MRAIKTIPLAPVLLDVSLNGKKTGEAAAERSDPHGTSCVPDEVLTSSREKTPGAQRKVASSARKETLRSEAQNGSWRSPLDRVCPRTSEIRF